MTIGYTWIHITANLTDNGRISKNVRKQIQGDPTSLEKDESNFLKLSSTICIFLLWSTIIKKYSKMSLLDLNFFLGKNDFWNTFLGGRKQIAKMSFYYAYC